jgi:hypothetical protein
MIEAMTRFTERHDALIMGAIAGVLLLIFIGGIAYRRQRGRTPRSGAAAGGDQDPASSLPKGGKPTTQFGGPHGPGGGQDD